MDTQLQLVRECLANLTRQGRLPADLAPESVERQVPIDSLGIDSLGKAEFLLELEKVCDGVLLSEQAENILTIDDLCIRLRMEAPEPSMATASAIGSLGESGASGIRGDVDSREGSLSDYQSVRSSDLLTKVRDFGGFLEDLRERGDEKYLLPIREYRGGRATVQLSGEQGGSEEKEVIVYCSANYLGLSFHPETVDSVAASVKEFGASAASVPLIAGSTSLHFELQRRLAKFLGTEDVVLYPTGHAANVGAISALAGPRDLVVLDKQVHYSILEGVRLSGARWVSFRHSDPEDLRKALCASRETHPDSGILVIVEGVYGIDGDVAPLSELMPIVREYGARIMIDDAHATGVIGERGAGSLDFHRLESTPDLIMGSLSKSLGSMGGWIATDKATADYLRYFSKTIVFSVGLPAINIAAAIASLDLIEKEPERIDDLRDKVHMLKDGLLKLGLTNVSTSSSSILSVLVGEERVLRDISRELFEEGIWAEALPFPAVTRGQERVRFRVSTLHTKEDIEQTIAAVGKVFRKHGLVDENTRSSVADSESRGPESMVELARKAAAVRGLPLPWLTPDFYERVLHRSGHWASDDASRFFVREHDGELAAACVATVTKVHLEGTLRDVGFIGHVHWLPDAASLLKEVLGDALRWLEGTAAQSIFAPVHTPLPILGGGIVRLGDPSRGPFLEPATSPDCYQAFAAAGFRKHTSHVYRRVSLPQAKAALGEGPEASELPLRIRPLERARLQDDVGALLSAFNASLGAIELCAPVSPELFYGVARDLRELIVSELWQIAELDGRVVGFAGAFPDVSQGFLQAGGSAGVADLDLLKDLVDRAERGFLAWLAVDPEFAGRGIGKNLLRRVYQEMEEKGYNEILLSWEMRDGVLTDAELAPPNSKIEDRVEYEIFRL